MTSSKHAIFVRAIYSFIDIEQTLLKLCVTLFKGAINGRVWSRGRGGGRRWGSCWDNVST